MVLSDDPEKLALLRAELAAHAGGALEGDAHSIGKDALLLEKRALTSGR